MPPDDDTADALTSIRGLTAEHVAAIDDPGPAPLDPAAQVALALTIVEETRAVAPVEDERALGLPATADASDWQATVARCVDDMDAALVVDAWLRQVELRRRSPPPAGARSAARARAPRRCGARRFAPRGRVARWGC